MATGLNGTLQGTNAQTGPDFVSQQAQTINPGNPYQTPVPEQDPIYQMLMQQANNPGPVPQQPTPGVSPPLGTFASLLAANLGSSLMRQPGYALPTYQELANQRANLERVQQENAAHEYASSENAKRDRLAALMRINEVKLQNAQRTNDIELEGQLQKERLKLENDARAVQEEANRKNQLQIARLYTNERLQAAGLRYYSRVNNVGGMKPNDLMKLQLQVQRQSLAEANEAVSRLGGPNYLGDPTELQKQFYQMHTQQLFGQPDWPTMNAQTGGVVGLGSEKAPIALPETVVRPKGGATPAPQEAGGRPAKGTVIMEDADGSRHVVPNGSVATALKNHPGSRVVQR